MKRMLALLFVVALSFTVISGCASQSAVKQLQADQDAMMQRLDALEQKQIDTAKDCEDAAKQCEDAARRAEAAADRAEAMADKCESIFMKQMKK
jgi:outer membrane murein-binding lipoprotein Lpp